MTPSLLASINGGGPVSGSIVCNPGDTVQFSVASTIGIEVYRYAFPGGSYPDSFATPSGWTLDGSSKDIFWSGPSPLPPLVTMPASAVWGEWLPNIQANGDPTQIDTSMAINIPSPINGLLETALGESTQVDPVKRWLKHQQLNLRKIEAMGASRTNLRGLYSARPAAGTLGRLYLCSDVPFVYFDDGANWQQHYLVNTTSPGGLVGGYTALNCTFDSTHEQFVGFGDSFIFSCKRASDTSLHGLIKGTTPSLSTPYRTTLALLPSWPEAAQYPMAAVALFDQAHNTQVTWALYSPGGGSTNATFSHWTAFSRDYHSDVTGVGDIQAVKGTPKWISLYNDGTNFVFQVSSDGATWETLLTPFAHTDVGSGLSTFVPDHYGVGICPYNATSVGLTALSLTCG